MNNKNRPSKKDFADAINGLMGKSIMSEEKMDKFLKKAKKSYKNKGMDGFFDFVRGILPAPVSNDFMKGLLQQMQDPEKLKDLLSQNELPFNLGKDRKGETTLKSKDKK